MFNEEEFESPEIVYNRINNLFNGKVSIIEVDLEPILYSNIKSKYLETTTCCPVCFEEFKQDDEVILLKCDHFYHHECVNNFILYNPSCPVCREDIDLKKLDMEAVYATIFLQYLINSVVDSGA
jgi:hypothetical protein